MYYSIIAIIFIIIITCDYSISATIIINITIVNFIKSINNFVTCIKIYLFTPSKVLVRAVKL